MYRWIRPLLFKIDAEKAHTVAISTAKALQLLPGFAVSTESRGLAQELWGIRFENPVGIAAGLDKNAECIPYWARLGCGFAEVGSVSADPAPGNPKPRAFRLPADRALINRMGLNNDGAHEIAMRIPKRSRRAIPVGINIVKTHRAGLEGSDAIADFCSAYRILAPLADFVTLNVSCPNTADGKTFEEPGALDDLLTALAAVEVERPTMLIKLSPGNRSGIDTERLKEIVAIAKRHDIAGFVASNTASDRDGLATSATELDRIGKGGLSGRPLAKRSTELVRNVYRLTSGEMPIIGVGGIDSADSALDKIRAGASLVQLYTGLVYEGPRLIRRIVQGLTRRLEREGKTIAEIVGTEA